MRDPSSGTDSLQPDCRSENEPSPAARIEECCGPGGFEARASESLHGQHPDSEHFWPWDALCQTPHVSKQNRGNTV